MGSAEPDGGTLLGCVHARGSSIDGCPLLAEVGRPALVGRRELRVSLVVARLGVRNLQRDGDDGSVAAGRGQFRWRSWSVAAANVGMWLAFCSEARVNVADLAAQLTHAELQVADQEMRYGQEVEN